MTPSDPLPEKEKPMTSNFGLADLEVVRQITGLEPDAFKERWLNDAEFHAEAYGMAEIVRKARQSITESDVLRMAAKIVQREWAYPTQFVNQLRAAADGLDRKVEVPLARR